MSKHMLSDKTVFVSEILSRFGTGVCTKTCSCLESKKQEDKDLGMRRGLVIDEIEVLVQRAKCLSDKYKDMSSSPVTHLKKRM